MKYEGMMSPYCYLGWPIAVTNIYLKALAALDGDNDALCYGPAHIVWDDGNLDSAEWCLEHFDEQAEEYAKGMYTKDELAIVRRSLEELINIPLNKRYVYPKDSKG